MKRLPVLLIILMLLCVSDAFAATRGYVGNFMDKGLSGFNVLAYGATGNGSTDDRTAINNAHTAATVNGNNLIFPPGTYKIGSNITFNSDVTLVFLPSAKLSVDNTFTATINGKIGPTLHQIFSGAGSVVISSKSVKEVVPQWWGAVGNNSNDDTTAIQAAITAIGNGTVFLPAGEYKITATLTMSTTGTTLKGAGWLESAIEVYGGVNGIEISSHGCTVKDLWIRTATVDNGTGSGIVVSASFRTMIDHCVIGSNGTNNYFNRGVELSGISYYSTVQNCYFRYNTTGIYLWNGGAGAPPNACRLINNNILHGSYAVNIVGVESTRVESNTMESYSTRAVLVSGDFTTIINNGFESSSVQPIELLSGSDQSYIAFNTVSFTDSKEYVLDNSGEDYNTVLSYRIPFGFQGLHGPVDDNYGGLIELAEDAGTIGNLKIEATKQNLELEASASGKVIDFLSDTQLDSGKRFDAQTPLVFTPVGGFGERAENKLKYSEDFSNGNWIKTNITVTTDQAEAPNGRTTADKVVNDTATARIQQNIGGVQSGELIRFRVWARAVSSPIANCRLRIWGPSANSVSDFSLTTTWKLLEKTLTAGGTETYQFEVYPDYNVISSEVYLWGAQVIIGSDDTPVPYIKTTNQTIAVDTPALVAADGIVAGGAGYFGGDVSILEASPELLLHNTTQEDGDGGRESVLRWKGEQSGGELTTLAMLRGSHDGAADDEKGQLEVLINDTNDADSPTLRTTWGADGSLNHGDGGTTDYMEIAGDGFVELHGTARATVDISFDPSNVKLPAANFPALAEIGLTPVFLFDKTADEELRGAFEIPHAYSPGSDLQAHFHWAPVDGGAGDVTWGVEWHAALNNNNDVLTAGTTTQIVVDTTESLQDEPLLSGNITIDGTGLVEEMTLHFRIFRDANASEGGASDTYGDDAALIRFDVEVTVDGFGVDRQY